MCILGCDFVWRRTRRDERKYSCDKVEVYGRISCVRISTLLRNRLLFTQNEPTWRSRAGRAHPLVPHRQLICLIWALCWSMHHIMLHLNRRVRRDFIYLMRKAKTKMHATIHQEMNTINAPFDRPAPMLPLQYHLRGRSQVVDCWNWLIDSLLLLLTEAKTNENAKRNAAM